jgi:spoIIIJ-associated protein
VAETLATEAGGTDAAVRGAAVIRTAVTGTAAPGAVVQGPVVPGAMVSGAESLSLSSEVSSDVVDHETDTANGGTADGIARSARTGPASEDLLVQEGDVAGDYLERLLDLVDYDGDIDLDVEAGRAIVSIDGGNDLEKLVGPRGTVLEALQELTRLAVQQQTGARSRLMLDIAQWRSARRSDLGELGRSTAERVRENGEPARLQPMTPFERKIVHDAVAAVDGVHSQSEGEEPRRCVVVFRSV